MLNISWFLKLCCFSIKLNILVSLETSPQTSHGISHFISGFRQTDCKCEDEVELISDADSVMSELHAEC